MASLVAAKCPNCGANLRLDPDRDFVTCSYGQTSAFVRTRTRTVTQQIAQQYPFVIDVPTPQVGWALAVLAVLLLSAGAWAAYVALGRRPPATIAAPTSGALDRDVPVQYTPSVEGFQRAAEPGREMWDVSRSPTAPTSTVMNLPGGNAPGASTGGRVSAATKALKDVRVREGTISVSGRLSPAEVRGVVRQNFGRFRLCYEQGLTRTPNLQGRVAVRFVVGRDGTISNVSHADSDLGDSRVVSCIVSAFYGLSFPSPSGGIVTVVYPLLFSHG